MQPVNYPDKYILDTAVRGRPYRFRPISPDDETPLIELYKTFSRETIFHRFFTAYTMPPSRAKRLATLDYDKKMAIVAEETTDCGCHLVGVARYANVSESETTAEMAIVIGDPWQGKGLGAALLDYLFTVGEAEGYELFYGLVHYENEAVPRLFAKINRPHRIHNTGTELRYEVTLSPKTGRRDQ
ncbi:MAG: GNAT family N-acetyltransferase [bacterium]